MIRVRQTPLVAMELKESIYASCSVAGVVSCEELTRDSRGVTPYMMSKVVSKAAGYCV